MRKVYHLGLHKTGSTSLQFYLQHNQQQLARAGILFPPVTPEGLAHFAADAAGGPRRTPAINDYMGHNALAYQMIAERVAGHPLPAVHAPLPRVADILRQIKTHAQDLQTQTLVLCSEDLARASLMVPDVPAQLAKAFGTDDVTLIATLRRPDDAIAAWQTQRLRFTHPFGPLHEDPPEAWLGTVHLEYRAALDPWLRAFRGAQLQLIPYTELRRRGGAVDSFGALAGLELPHMETLPDKNPGLPYALQEVARRALGALPPVPRRMLVTYLESVPARLDLPGNADIDLFAPDTRATLARSFADIHDWLCQVTGRWPFFEDLPEMTRPRAQTLLQATQAILPALQHDAQTHLENPGARAFVADFRV